RRCSARSAPALGASGWEARRHGDPLLTLRAGEGAEARRPLADAAGWRRAGGGLGARLTWARSTHQAACRIIAPIASRKPRLVIAKLRRWKRSAAVTSPRSIRRAVQSTTPNPPST